MLYSSSAFRNRRTNTSPIMIIFGRMVYPLICLSFLLFFWLVSTERKSLRGTANKVVIVSKSQYQAIENPLRIQSTFNLTSSQPTVPITSLIIVPGHAVLRFEKVSTADRDDNSWYLLPYQRKQGFPHVISAHIARGISLLKSNPQNFLIFSGGQTRKDVGPYSEALSYFFLAHRKKWLDDGLDQRVALEEFARDSFENLLFSICRFKEVLGYYPQKITVVGFDFKAKRFSTLHRAAIHIPAANFTYVGIQSSKYTKLFDQAHAESGELHAVEDFEKDLYGCQDPELAEKRTKRNPFHRSIPYELACPELKQLLEWCGPGIIEATSLPWVTTSI